MKRFTICCLSLALFVSSLLLFGANNALAQSYPNKSIQMIVPFTPGGSNDILARIIADKLTEKFGHQVVVLNKPGADGAIGIGMAMQAKPDGYTILQGTSGSLAITPSIMNKVKYDPVRSFEPITLLNTTTVALLISPSIKVNSVKELIELCKSKPGVLNYASPSSVYYLMSELFKVKAGVDIRYVPYKGSGQSMAAIMSGESQVSFASLGPALPFIESNKVRAIAVCTTKRSPLLPNVPTVSETRGLEGFEATTWSGILAPLGTPKAIVEMLNTEIVKILKMADVKKNLESAGNKLIGSTPEEFRDFIKSELNKYQKVIIDAKITRIEG